MKKFRNLLIMLAFLALSTGTINAQKWYIGTPDTAAVTATLIDGTMFIDGTGKMQDFKEGTAPWYDIRNSISKLIISNTVTHIGNYAFMDCNSLTGTLTLPNYLKSIGKSAFENCSALSGYLKIPNTVWSIGDYAFRFCSGFTSIRLSSNLMYMGYQVFADCKYGKDKYADDDYYRGQMFQKMMQESGNVDANGNFKN